MNQYACQVRRSGRNHVCTFPGLLGQMTKWKARCCFLSTKVVYLYQSHDAKHTLRATLTCMQNIILRKYIYISSQCMIDDRVLMAQRTQPTTAYPRDSPPVIAPTRQSKYGLLSTRRHAFVSSGHQWTQPTWACCAERERGYQALSLPWPAHGTRYRDAERHPGG
jgi:hypothetical protein